MLRPLITLSVLSSAILLTACQSMSHNTHSSYTPKTGYNAQSLIAYNDWQWEYFSNINQKNTSSDSIKNWNSQLLATPKKAVEATSGNLWGYDYQADTIHPNNWGNISGNQQCASGLQQSPINIVKAVIPLPSVTRTYNLQFNYQPQSFSILDNGRTIAFIATEPKASSISVQGKTYYLVGMNYHAVSEHAIMGVHLPLELQLVHASQDGAVLTISALVNVGSENIGLQPMVTALPKHKYGYDSAKAQLLSNFNAGEIIPNYSFYVYDGSFTTPPCKENNKWLVATQALTASSEQIYSFQTLYKGNNRPVQRQGNRTVYLIR